MNHKSYREVMDRLRGKKGKELDEPVEPGSAITNRMVDRVARLAKTLNARSATIGIVEATHDDGHLVPVLVLLTQDGTAMEPIAAVLSQGDIAKLRVDGERTHEGHALVNQDTGAVEVHGTEEEVRAEHMLRKATHKGTIGHA